LLLLVVPDDAPIRKVVRITGLDKVVATHRSLDEALVALA
jgi:hypothetical protein